MALGFLKAPWETWMCSQGEKQRSWFWTAGRHPFGLITCVSAEGSRWQGRQVLTWTGRKATGHAGGWKSRRDCPAPHIQMTSVTGHFWDCHQLQKWVKYWFLKWEHNKSTLICWSELSSLREVKSKHQDGLAAKQGFSHLSLPGHHWRAWESITGPDPQVSYLVGRVVPHNVHFPGVLMLLVEWPHFENHCIRVFHNKPNEMTFPWQLFMLSCINMVFLR